MTGGSGHGVGSWPGPRREAVPVRWALLALPRGLQEGDADGSPRLAMSLCPTPACGQLGWLWDLAVKLASV